MNIGFDIDLVLVDIVPDWIRHLEYKSCKKIDLTKYSKLPYTLNELYGLEYDGYFDKKDLYDNLKPINNSVEILKQLSLNHEIHLISKVMPGHIESKVKFIRKYFPFIENIHLTNDKSCVNVDIMIDDRADNLNTMGCKRVLFETVYRQTEELVNGVHINKLDEIFDILKKENMLNKKDIKDVKFNLLTGIKDSNKKGFYVFKCDCGNVVEKRKNDVIQGKTKSCGCIKSKNISKARKKHGACGTKLYKIFCGMRQRCLNKKNKRYKNYGGRGITIYKDWLSDYSNFNEWALNNGYEEGLSIERIDNNGDYEPNNCKWIELKEQARNKSCTIKMCYNGEMMLLKDLCVKFNVDYRLALSRYRKGYTFEEVFSLKSLYKDKAHFNVFTLNGETKNLSDWCKIYNKNYSTVWARIYRYGKSFEYSINN